jgi:hypothetical protein
METLPSVKHKVFKALGTLPPQGLEELSWYLDFLVYKYRGAHGDQVLAPVAAGVIFPSTSPTRTCAPSAAR